MHSSICDANRTLVYEALQNGERPDLLAVEMIAVDFGDYGLADLAELARKRGNRLGLLTSRSVMDTDACASLLGAARSDRSTNGFRFG